MIQVKSTSELITFRIENAGIKTPNDSENVRILLEKSLNCSSNMNMELKAIYFCATNGHRWGKGYSPDEAKKNAGLTSKTQEKRCQYYVMAAIFNDPTDEALKNLHACIAANQMSGSPEYYKDGRTAEDTAMINAHHIGWLTVEKNY